METFCVCAGLLQALKKSIHPARLLFFLLLLSELKLPPGFKAALWGGSVRAAQWQCYHAAVQEMSAWSLGSKQLCDYFIAVFP